MKRTLKQNSSLHKYGTELAEVLNSAGITRNFVLQALSKEGYEIPWTLYAIKDIFRSLGLAMFGKDSTAKLDSDEMQEVYQAFDEMVSNLTGIHVEWPSEDRLRMENYLQNLKNK